ncbi:hypothetical protein A2575_03490 [Candidatus Roizmanbacteria bacterium RIFOXYD1_FULL_41_24]|nr:MAG: hypothetical protein A2575_03490 [Candidatus Roizmanbacteria bacterium RIFOXYD1_FULL_41_24]
MFNQQGHLYKNRLILAYFVLLSVFLILLQSLFSKTILGHKYYHSLSETNRVKEEKIIAPRGVFLDRDGRLLVVNDKNELYGYSRRYLYPKATAHLLGYLSLPDEVNLQDYSCGAQPLTNQFIGKTGLEKYFECRLRGQLGKAIYETNALGEKTRELARQEPKEGENIKLTVSLKLQKTALKAFGSLKGAAIASNPKTGEILLFHSSPSYNNNQIVRENGLYTQLSQDENKPLFNRLALGLYPPGSVVKPLIALGALENGVITPETQYTDNGIFKLGGVEFGNWYYLQYGKTEGEVDVIKGIKRSNDIFFYHLGVEMGIGEINRWLTKFGLKEQSLQQYFNQSQSLLPNAQWKKQTLNEPWYLGDTVNLSIGQGYLLVNPVQFHVAASIIASNGHKCQLAFDKNSLRHCQDLRFDQKHLDTVIQGMVQACSPGGTGWPFFDYKINGKQWSVACKTGTAESTADGALPHAWFTVFAPVLDPEIVLTVLVENGGEGSEVAAPIAKQILTEFFSQD